MKRAIAILLVATTCQAREYAPALWSAWYWAADNSVPTNTVSVQRSGGTWLIYTNGTSTGVKTASIDQGAAILAQTPMTNQTQFVQAKWDADGIETDGMGAYPVSYNHILAICTNGQEICPPMGFDDVSIGSTNRPFARVCVSSNSLWVGMAHIRSDEDKLITDNLEIGAKGFESKGRGKIKDADLEIQDVYRGLIMRNVNSNKYSIWIDNGGNVHAERITFSPEVSFSNRVQRIKAKDAKIEASRKGFKPQGQLQARIEWLENFIRENFDIDEE